MKKQFIRFCYTDKAPTSYAEGTYLRFEQSFYNDSNRQVVYLSNGSGIVRKGQITSMRNIPDPFCPDSKYYFEIWVRVI